MKQDFKLAHAEPESKIVSAIFASDTHLFNPYNAALHVQGAHLQNKEFEHIYLLGDIIDFEHLHKMLKKTLKKTGASLDKIPKDFFKMLETINFSDPEAHLRYLDSLMAQKERGTIVSYINGNHDSNLENIKGQDLNGIHIEESMIININNTVTQIAHGHKSDSSCQNDYKGTLINACCDILDTGLQIDHALKKVFHSVAPKTIDYPFPISNTFKAIGKLHIHSFRSEALRQAKEHGAQAVIAGHIHRPEIRTTSNGKYYNAGDGLTHGTALEYSAEDGFNIVTRKNTNHEIAAHFIQGENPYKAYRKHTVDFIQGAWETFVKNVDMEANWNHAGNKTPTHKSTTKQPIIEHAL